jgi:Protein of unknown function (DUF4230)
VKKSSTTKMFGAASVAVIAVSVAVGAMLLAVFGGVFGFLKNPLATEKVDRTGPALLTAVRSLARIEGSSGTFQVVVDIEEDAKYLPGALKGQRIIYLAQGSASGTVELGGINETSMTVDEETKSVVFRVPHAQISNVRIDPKASRVLSYERGILDRLNDAVGQIDPLPQELNQRAEAQLNQAAIDSELVGRAEVSTEQVLRSIANGLGYDDVTVTFVEGPASGSTTPPRTAIAPPTTFTAAA